MAHRAVPRILMLACPNPLTTKKVTRISKLFGFVFCSPSSNFCFYHQFNTPINTVIILENVNKYRK